MTDKFIIRKDCRLYRGDKPCRPGALCSGCGKYDKFNQRILVVKLAAAGDVLRTTPLLRAMKKLYPGSYITWITDPGGRVLLKGNPFIDELVTYGFEGLLPLAAREFEWAVVLDKEPRAACLGTMVKAARKTGFGLDSSGRLTTLNPESQYALRLGLDDRLKFRENRLTYPEIVFGMCGLPYSGEEYVFTLDEKAGEKGREILLQAGWDPDKTTVGLNTGCGDIFATKKWTEEGFVKLAEEINGRLGFQVVLLGGPEERERNRRIREKITVPVVDGGADNTLEVFTGIVAGCDMIVTADTLALHVAIALKKEIVLLMGPTASSEIDLFGRGEILDAALDCAPCYRQSCSEGALCMSSISPEMVFEAVERRSMVQKKEGQGK